MDRIFLSSYKTAVNMGQIDYLCVFDLSKFALCNLQFAFYNSGLSGLGFNIGIQADDDGFVVYFGGGDNISPRACNDKGFTGCRRSRGFQVNFDIKFVVLDFNFHCHWRISFY